MSDYSFIDLGTFLGSVVMLGINGFRQKTVTVLVTSSKSIVLRGKTKLILSSIILLAGSALFLGFVWILLIMAGA